MASLPTFEGAGIPASTPAFQRLRDYILEGREAQIGELRIASSEGPEVSCQIIVVGEFEGQFLVAVPQGAWHRVAGRRYLPRETLARTVQAEVLASSEEDPSEPHSLWRMKVWLGMLQPNLEDSVDFALEGELQPDVVFTGFGSRSQVRMLPYGPSLSAIAADHFAFLTAAEDPIEEGGSENAGGVEGQAWEQRLRSLEQGMRQLQTSMQALVDGVPLSREEPAGPSAEAASAAGVGAFLGAPPGLTRPPRLAGLDPGVVDAARAAGVQEDQLVKMSQMAASGRGRLGGRAKAAPRRAADPLDESDDEVARGAGEGDGPISGNQISQAMIQISQVLKAMHSEREKRNDLEELLDRADGASDALGGAGSSGRSKAAAFHKLRGILRTSPELIAASIEALIAEDFSLAQSGPSLEDRKCTVRGWVEHRSHLQQFAGPIRSAWTLASIVDQLNNDQPEAAKATALLALASLDQAAIDQGNWLLASEFSMQPSPPFSAFQRPRTLDPLESRQTKIIDPRWISVFMSRLKERDAFHTAKKNLSGQGSSAPPGGTASGDAARGSGDLPPKPPRKPPKGGGKGADKEK